MPLLEMSRTVPTTTSRTLTSAPWLSCSPIRSARSVTQVTGTNAFWYTSTDSPAPAARMATKASPSSRRVIR